MNSEPSESWNPLVVDISSDDENDKYEGDNSFESMFGWLSNDTDIDATNDIVDVDKYILSLENYSSLIPTNRVQNDNSRADNDRSGTDNDKSMAENDRSMAVNHESDDDCMVLDGDPDKIVEIHDDNKKGGEESDDLQIVGEKGQIACRDFPHSRHLCVNFPFETTPHEQLCNLCHCFVCDSPAPCIYWHNIDQLSGHCHATDKDEMWKIHRRMFKTLKSSHLPSPNSLLEVQNLDMITNHTRVPVRPCSNAITTQPISEHRRNRARLIKSNTMPRTKSFGLYRTASHTHHKRVGSIGSGFTSSTMNQSQQRSSVPNQVHRHVRKGPFQTQPPLAALQTTQSMPMITQRSSHTHRTSQTDDSMRKWQDVLAGVAAELGVSDAVSSSTMSSQSSKSTPSQHVSNSNQLGTDMQSAAQFINSTNQNAAGNPDFDCYFSAVDTDSLPEFPALDATSFSYELDDSWMQ